MLQSCVWTLSSKLLSLVRVSTEETVAPPFPCLPHVKCRLVCIGGGEDSVEFSIDELSTLLGGPEPGVLHPHLGSSTLLHCSCICEMGWVRGPSTGLRARLDEGGVYARKTKLLSLQSGGQCYSPESPRV